MVVIRLSRAGTNKSPFYQVLVADSRKPNCGRFIERVGFYNPMARGKEICLQLDRERIAFWRNKGAQVTERLEFLLKQIEKGAPINQPAPRKGELKKAQIEASRKAAKVAVKKEEEMKPEEAKTEISTPAEASATETQPVEAKTKTKEEPPVAAD